MSKIAFSPSQLPELIAGMIALTGLVMTTSLSLSFYDGNLPDLKLLFFSVLLLVHGLSAWLIFRRASEVMPILKYCSLILATVSIIYGILILADSLSIRGHGYYVYLTLILQLTLSLSAWIASKSAESVLLRGAKWLQLTSGIGILILVVASLMDLLAQHHIWQTAVWLGLVSVALGMIFMVLRDVRGAKK
jgi:hypothetical protein